MTNFIELSYNRILIDQKTHQSNNFDLKTSFAEVSADYSFVSLDNGRWINT